MGKGFERIVVSAWNAGQKRRANRVPPGQLRLGLDMSDSDRKRFVYLFQSRRPEHVAILGKTGTGKSSLLRFLCEQDIRSNRSFVLFDLHGDATPMILSAVAAEERRRGRDLSHRLIVLDPADREHSVGINILEASDDHQRFVQVADLAQILRDRWRLDTLGVRTEELLRNSLHVLMDNRLTLIELGPLLTDSIFRARLLSGTRNSEARRYFLARYNAQSEPMQAVYREAVLNKVTVFTSDPHFRHILGQARSTVRLSDVVEGGYWIVVNLDKGRLGEQATTLGSLLLTKLRHTLFARRSRSLLTLYCDELQNLVAYDAGIESLMSEARKLRVSVASANQYFDQYPERMQAAVLAAGTLIFFQLSARDASRIARSLGAGAHLAEQIRNLPPRQMIAKLSGQMPRHLRVPDLPPLGRYPAGLYRRTIRRWGRKRTEIEAEILLRLGQPDQKGDPLDAWE